MQERPPETEPEPDIAAAARSRARRLALSLWETEVGAGLTTPAADEPQPADAESHLMRARVIAQENLVIALLADASEQQRLLAFDMGEFISPRPGDTPHPLTPRAAEAMRSLLGRAGRFCDGIQPPAAAR